MKSVLTIILILSYFFANAQIDTVINKTRYNYVEYYQPKQIKSIGNIKDSLKTGKWTYFKPNGKFLAKGEYLNGKKTGKWKYVDYDNKKHLLKWNIDQQSSEIFIIEGIQLNLYDMIKIPNGAQFMYIQYVNGKAYKSLLY